MSPFGGASTPSIAPTSQHSFRRAPSSAAEPSSSERDSSYRVSPFEITRLPTSHAEEDALFPGAQKRSSRFFRIYWEYLTSSPCLSRCGSRSFLPDGERYGEGLQRVE